MAARIRDGKGKAAYGRARARLKRDVKENGTACWICGAPIDLTLPRTDRMSFTADHVDALANGGKLAGAELRPAHLSCNARRSNHQDAEIWEAS